MKLMNVASLVVLIGSQLLTVSARATESCRKSDFEGVTQVQGEVVRVVDGDTAKVKIRGEEHSVRFLLIDTPETHYQGKSQGIWGERAAARLKELLPVGTKVTVKFDGDACDKYQRVLGHVWVGKTHINRQMIAEGWAVNYCIWPSTLSLCEDFARVVHDARAAQRNMWSDKSLELPYEWRRRVSNRQADKYVGDIFTHEVHQPGADDRVTVEERIFFFTKSDIKPPFHVTD